MPAVTVFCGSASGLDPQFAAAADRLGEAFAARGIELVYGGGRLGLMGRVADACLGAGGRVVGIIPSFLRTREVDHSGVSELIEVASMHERKQLMFERSDGFVVLPGGIGTLEETIEVLSWRHLGLHDKPIVLVDIAGYWSPLAALIEHLITSGFAGATSRDRLAVARTIEAVFPALGFD